MSDYIYLKPEQSETGRYSLIDSEGSDVYSTLNVSPGLMQKAVSNEQAIRYNPENERARRVDMEMYLNTSQSSPPKETESAEDLTEIQSFINKAVGLKPDNLFIDDLLWKYVLRNILRARNTLMTGETGSGKNVTIRAAADALNRKLYKFNLGATQDPRGALIGNTHFSKEKGTFFNKSPFIKAIQEPNAIVLLDELSRANPEASNILMTALDDGQRYIRLDEDTDSPIVEIHPTVTFMATANIGVEYSSTRVIDRALKDRFIPINMEYLSEKEEFELLNIEYPNVSNHNLKMVAKAVTQVRNDVNSDDGQLMHNLSTRHSIEMASLLNDGFSMKDALKLVVWPQYDTDGGTDSDQTYVKQLIQSVITEEPEQLDEDTVDEDDDVEIPPF